MKETRGKPRKGRPSQTTSTVRAQRAYDRDVIFKRDILDVKQHLALLERKYKKKPHMKTAKCIKMWTERFDNLVSRKKAQVVGNFIKNNKPLTPLVDEAQLHEVYLSLKSGERVEGFTLLPKDKAITNETVVALIDITQASHTLCMYKDYLNGQEDN